MMWVPTCLIIMTKTSKCLAVLLHNAISIVPGLLMTDVFLDGRDVSSLFLNGSNPPSKPLFWYAGDFLIAVRFKSYKIIYGMQGWGESWVLFPECGPENLTKVDPPLIYQVEHDPSERFPLNNTSEEYQQVLAMTTAAITQHNKTLVMKTPELDRVEDPSTSLCCHSDPNPGPPWKQCVCGQSEQLFGNV
eukprot:m.138109 g.138109  ORF g.138109 m.138109 type:complete len:190 (+) comp14767_c0_seq13:1285-1854(+)